MKNREWKMLMANVKKINQLKGKIEEEELHRNMIMKSTHNSYKIWGKQRQLRDNLRG